MSMPKSFTVKIVGVTFMETYPSSITSLSDGDPVRVVREPDNPHDPNAVRVDDADGIPLGYVPAAVAKRLADDIDAGVRYKVTVSPLIDPTHAEQPGALLHVSHDTGQ